jgi:5'-nucleotidase/UDP-sugar diphosphatase
VGGVPIDPAKRYRLAVNNFTAIGGDGYPKLQRHPNYVDSGFNDAEVLRAYIAAHSPLKVADYANDGSMIRN